MMRHSHRHHNHSIYFPYLPQVANAHIPTHTHTHRSGPRQPPAEWAEQHMTSFRCQWFSEASLCTCTSSTPAVRLLYMAGLVLHHEFHSLCPFMWLQEEKTFTEQKSFVAGAVMQDVCLLLCTDLNIHKKERGRFGAQWGISNRTSLFWSVVFRQCVL